MREANRKTREKYAARTLEEVLAAQPDECVCPVCKMLRSKTEFSIDRTRRNGLQAICTPCRVLMNKLAHQLKQS
jgi:rubredoxin